MTPIVEHHVWLKSYREQNPKAVCILCGSENILHYEYRMLGFGRQELQCRCLDCNRWFDVQWEDKNP